MLGLEDVIRARVRAIHPTPPWIYFRSHEQQKPYVRMR
jgi:hypothetical protein